jgi:hypothetical protein
MPSGKKPSSDPSVAARSILDQVIGAKPKVEPSEKNPSAVELGRRGGEARKAALPAEERKRIASEAARKRWGDRPKP